MSNSQGMNKPNNSRPKMKSATFGEFRKALRTSKPVHLFDIGISKTKFDVSQPSDFEKWFLPTVVRRLDTTTNKKID
jgi:hypothetical protein